MIRQKHFLAQNVCRGLGILCGVIWMIALSSSALQVQAEEVEGIGSWRRTVRGWEYAHAIQSRPNATTKVVFTPSAKTTPLTNIQVFHRTLFPIAVTVFLLTFGSWLIIGIPNHAMKIKPDSSLISYKA